MCTLPSCLCMQGSRRLPTCLIQIRSYGAESGGGPELKPDSPVTVGIGAATVVPASLNKGKSLALYGSWGGSTPG